VGHGGTYAASGPARVVRSEKVTRSNEEAVRAGNAGSPADEPLAVTVNLDDL